MNGELAQVVALVAHGNHFLHGNPVNSISNSTFQYCSAVKFARYENNRQTKGVEIAGDVETWFDFLRANRVNRLWNVAFAWDRPDLPEHIAASFAGGVPRAIQADMSKGYELWYPLWQTGGPQDKPWFIEYRGLMFSNSHIYPALPMGLVKVKLREAIAEAKAFSQRPQVEAAFWADYFSKSLLLLDSPDPVPPFHPDILPESGFDLETRQVLAAAMQSYVFGGMGSWNDMGFADKNLNEDYQKITGELYRAVNMSIMIAANSYS